MGLNVLCKQYHPYQNKQSLLIKILWNTIRKIFKYCFYKISYKVNANHIWVKFISEVGSTYFNTPMFSRNISNIHNRLMKKMWKILWKRTVQKGILLQLWILPFSAKMTHVKYSGEANFLSTEYCLLWISTVYYSKLYYYTVRG
jgi:hypothetical protein